MEQSGFSAVKCHQSSSQETFEKKVALPLFYILVVFCL